VKLQITALAGSALVQGVLSGEPEALAFYPGGDPRDPESYRKKAQETAGRFDRKARLRLAGALTGGGPEAAQRLHRFVEEEGFCVTTGQQPGLFGGPLYSLYKALTTVALAERLEKMLGVPVLPVFWVASEDHDWEEVRSVTLPDLENQLQTLSLEIPAGAERAPLHRIPLGEALDSLREACLALSPPTEFLPLVADALTRSYTAGQTLPGAFAELLRQQLGGEGLFVLSPESEVLQEAALPVLLAEARGADARDRALQARVGELEAAGYSAQVPILPHGVNLFFEGAQGRDRLFLEPAEERGAGGQPPRFRLRNEGRILSEAELRAEAEKDPWRLSPNVLLRPVVESTLVPTLAYVAGPGELAYYGQTAPVFEAHGILQPVIHPRFSALLLESKISKVLEKFHLEPAALFRPLHEVVGQVVRDDLPDEVRQALGQLKGSVASGSKSLLAAVRGVDPTLSGPVDHLRNQCLALLEDLERKVVQARKRQSATALQQIEKAQLHLAPLGAPQERVFPALYYLLRYGPEVMRLWREAAEGAVLLPNEVE
jgi:bacillithiol synthase